MHLYSEAAPPGEQGAVGKTSDGSWADCCASTVRCCAVLARGGGEAATRGVEKAGTRGGTSVKARNLNYVCEEKVKNVDMSNILKLFRNILEHPPTPPAPVLQAWEADGRKCYEKV